MLDIFPENLQPRIEPIWPWPVMVVLVVALVGLVLRTYPKRMRHLPRIHQRLLLGLRLISLLVLFWAMFRPSLVITETDERSGQLVIVTENSRSLTLKDGPGGISRRETILKLLNDNRDLLDKVSEEIELVQYEFNSEIAQIEKREDAADGEMTAIGFALDSLTRTINSELTTGIILMSDGAQRALPPYDVDPRAAIRQFRAAHNTPIYPVGVGSTSLSDSSLDVIAEDLQVNPTVFVKNRVVVGANIRALGVANRDLTVRLNVEDLSIRGSSKMRQAAPAVKLRTNRTEDVLPVEVEFIPQQPGEYKISLEVDPVDGELMTTNNVLTTFITVLKGGLSVAYFDVFRPEYGVMREIDRSPDIQLDRLQVRYRGDTNRTKIDASWFEPGKYDVYIIGDVPAKVFGDPLLKRLRTSVERGAGLLMTGGFHSFGAGGYARSPLNDLLPVVMYPTELLGDDEFDSSLQIEEPVQMLPTSEGNNEFVMRLDVPANNRKRWLQLPKLEGANKLRPKVKSGLARVLAESDKQEPLLIVQDFDRGRTMAFAGDTTYLWYQAGFAAEHQQFWRQVILWLAHKESQGDDSVWVKLEGRRFRPGQPVPLTFGARDEEGQPLEGVEFNVQVVGPDDKKFSIPPRNEVGFSSASFLETTVPGEYRAEVRALKDGQPVGLTATARFVVYEQDLELHNPAADPSLLQEISSVTQGRFVRPEEFREFLEGLIEKGLNRELTQNHLISLWDNWVLIVLFVTVMSTEWFVRKKRGLI